MSSTKEKIQFLLNQLPDDCSIEDVQYHLYVLQKVDNGLKAAEAQRTILQNEVEHRLSKWFIL
ncbi:hypothetical protein RIVM261_058200 [Rivularia sp. IAM M-261]|nr:hypothetical protein CAL7716_033250 [Calothrix sp. PCC 7716]GJD20864.1 hypothetical protein RIVM261_058200 [Rivularia sp. IAM M-261]